MARFGGIDLVTEAQFDHYAIVGSTVSGKTTSLLMLMNSVINEPANLPPPAFIYDPKREFLAYLEGMGRKGDCLILNPMDARCAAWDIAKDFRTPIAARELATILTEGSEGGVDENKFFREAVRDILSAVMTCFIRMGRGSDPKWTFRDLVLTCLFPKYLESVLSHDRDPYGRPILAVIRAREVYLKGKDTRTRDNILASIQASLGVYEPIAAVWDWASKRKDKEWSRTFSISEWIDTREVLILGNDEGARSSIDPINRAIFQRTAELILSTPSQDVGNPVDRTWIVLDEVREAGKLPLLSRLLTKARSHGVTVVLAFQDNEGLKEEYGEHIAYELTAQCSNKLFLKVEGPSTAEWIASHFGENFAMEPSIADTASVHPSQTTTYQRQVKKNMYSSQPLFMPRTSTKTGMLSYTKHGEQAPQDPDVAFHADWTRDIEPYLPDRSDTPGYVPHDDPAVFDLSEFGPEDWERLGLDGVPPQL